MVKAMDGGIVVNDFELQFRYYVHDDTFIMLEFNLYSQ